MSWLIVWMLYRAHRTGEQVYRVMARFWIRLFSMMFVLGVATGIAMEIQFGTNWAVYSRVVGDIFGAPLAAEVIFAFFLESTFLSLLVFGEKRLSSRMYLFSSAMVALGATISAFWITVANSWMQTPTGYRMVEGRAELTDFFAVVLNPSTIVRFLHVVDGTLVSGSLFVVGISAWFLLKKRHIEFAERSMKAALIVAFVSSFLQPPLGHFQTINIANNQPEKLAVFEGIFDTTTHAPLLLFGIPNPEEKRTEHAVSIPGALSFLVSGDTSTEIQGLNDFPRDEWPPILLTFFSFHLMVVLGLFFIVLTGYGMVLAHRKSLTGSTSFLWVALLSIPLPIIANEIGWVATEVGRQPWIIYRVMRTSKAVSTVVPSSHILITLIVFCLIYACLFCAWMYLLKRVLMAGPEQLETEGTAEVSP